MDLLGLLKALSVVECMDDNLRDVVQCSKCLETAPIDEDDELIHKPDCKLKAAIDALESGRLVVVEKTAYNTRRVIRAMRLEKERKEKEHWT